MGKFLYLENYASWKKLTNILYQESDRQVICDKELGDGDIGGDDDIDGGDAQFPKTLNFELWVQWCSVHLLWSVSVADMFGCDDPLNIQIFRCSQYSNSCFGSKAIIGAMMDMAIIMDVMKMKSYIQKAGDFWFITQNSLSLHCV